MAQLNRPSLCDFIHIELQVTDVVQFLGLDKEFEAIIAYAIDSEIKHFQIWQAIMKADSLRPIGINIITTQVDLLNVPEVLTPKQVSNSLVTQVVPWQLQALYVLQEMCSSQMV